MTGTRLMVVGALAGAVALGSWPGCTVTKENYKTLSFFFDGVPDPSHPSATGGPGGTGPGAAVMAVVHKPFALENCDACHKTRFRPSRDNSQICLQCHAAVQTEHERMHGPVVATACLWCHEPHESAYPSLLRNTDRKVCAQCHSEVLLDTTRVPAHADPARGCLECHNGHGGSLPYNLKPGASADSPPPQPVPPGAAPEKK